MSHHIFDLAPSWVCGFKSNSLSGLDSVPEAKVPVVLKSPDGRPQEAFFGFSRQS